MLKLCALVHLVEELQERFVHAELVLDVLLFPVDLGTPCSSAREWGAIHWACVRGGNGRGPAMRGLHLNGWQRIGIVLSVVWAIVGGLYTLDADMKRASDSL